SAFPFYRSRHPPHLHSFPTRRSSDLAFIAAAEANGIPRNTDFNGAEMYGTGYWDLMAWNGRRSSTSLAYIAPNRHRPNLRVLTEDRKSTRLNSSHVKISYAVFCSKKK